MKALGACNSISSSSTIPHASAALEDRSYQYTHTAAPLLAYNKQMPRGRNQPRRDYRNIHSMDCIVLDDRIA